MPKLEHKDIEEKVEYCTLIIYYVGNTIELIIPILDAKVILESWKKHLKDVDNNVPLFCSNESNEYVVRLDGAMGMQIGQVEIEEPENPDEESLWEK